MIEIVPFEPEHLEQHTDLTRFRGRTARRSEFVRAGSALLIGVGTAFKK